MQVKKFEAKSMKEAIEMVKLQLGPEAVILSARDNSKGFGLAGETSVEVTAAISETTLIRKKVAESKLPAHLKEKFLTSSARHQRDFIQRAFEGKPMTEKPQPHMPPAVQRDITRVRYAEILDEEKDSNQMAQAVNTPSVRTENQSAEARIKSAVQRAFEAGRVTMAEEKPVPKATASSHPEQFPEKDAQIIALRREIQMLRSALESVHKVPQNMVSMHPGAEEGIPYELSNMYQKLLRAGVRKNNTIEILDQAKERLPREQLKKPAFVSAWVAKYLLDKIEIANERMESRYHAFVGPAGGGKTSSLVKLASHLVIVDKKKVALVTTDSHKVGAAEQLKIYAQILNVPFAIVRSPEDWSYIDRELSRVDHILVDYPGMNLKSISTLDKLRGMMPPSNGGLSIHYVQSVLAKDEDATDIAERYQGLGFNDFIFTGLDESVQHGIIYNFHKRFKKPLHSFGIGPQIPEDIEPATKERVVDLMFKLTKIKKKEGQHE